MEADPSFHGWKSQLALADVTGHDRNVQVSCKGRRPVVKVLPIPPELPLQHLTTVVLDHLVCDHRVAVAAAHEVLWHRHGVNLHVLHGLVVRDPTVGAEDVEAPHAAPRRFGDIKLHVKTCPQ